MNDRTTDEIISFTAETAFVQYINLSDMPKRHHWVTGESNNL